MSGSHSSATNPGGGEGTPSSAQGSGRNRVRAAVAGSAPRHGEPGRRSVVDVVGAVIRDGDRVLLAQRPEGKAQAGLWEFPGGKIEPGETPEEALARECREELALEIESPSVLRSVVHRYPEKTIRLILVACSVRPGSVPAPQEHQQVAWVAPEQLPAMDLCPADRELLPYVFSR